MAIKKIADSPSSDQGGRIIHKVRRGETLTGIAARYHTSVSNIKRWNGMRGNTIQVGQRLKIYGKSSGGSNASSSSSSKSSSSSGSSTYTVRRGDTLSSIASRHGISLNALLKLNGMSMKSKIYPGMKIRVK